ncbi:MAG: DUF1471 domain-containing protein [Candidatus Schmidhempelia sp.]|nr:DUF1471 domain-containing protein [Candidatus Schmidhempelia sp.]
MSNLKKTLMAISIAFAPVLSVQAQSDVILREAGTFANKDFRISSLELQRGGQILRLNTITDTSLPIIYPNPEKSTAITPETITKFKQINGVYVFPRNEVVALEPFDVVTVRSSYPNPTLLDYDISRLAAEKGAYAYQINSITQTSTDSNNVDVVFSLYHKNAAFLYVYKADFFTFGNISVQELPVGIANQYQAIGTFSFNGYYKLPQDISVDAAKQAIYRGAKAFFVKSVTENNQGTRQTVSVDYF